MITNLCGISDNRIAPFAAKFLEDNPGQALIITGAEASARRLAKDLSFFTRVPVKVLPDLDTAKLRFDAKSSEELNARLSALNLLASGSSCIIVCPAAGFLKKLPPKRVYTENFGIIRVGEEYSREKLISELAFMGYERSSLVEAEGCFAVRGDIVDFFEPGSERPVRIEFFDTEVDSIRSFDPETQRSERNFKSAEIRPAQLLMKDEEAFARAAAGIEAAYSAAAGKTREHDVLAKLNEQKSFLLDCIETESNFQYLEGFISYFYEKPEYIWDYAQNLSFIMTDDATRVQEAIDFMEKQSRDDKKDMLLRGLAVSADFDSLPSAADYKRINSLDCGVYYCTPFAQQIKNTDRLDALENVQSRQAPLFGGRMDILRTELESFIARSYDVCIACESAETEQALRDSLSENPFLAAALDRCPQNASDVRASQPGSLSLIRGSLSLGMELPEQKKLWLAEADVFPHAVKKRSRSRKNLGAKIDAFTDLAKGDYVVHENHGVGVFTGVERRDFSGSARDYLRIQYAGKDVLYIPVDQMDSVRKYVGGGGAAPKVSKLSSGEWQKTKAKARAAIKDMADDLLRESAKRESEGGFCFGPDSPWQKEFEDSFPYVETDDQLRCVEEIKRDMESPKAMDRLLCADVGYGKTEVACRAAFKCLEQGKQAAFLVPTTILANQHYHSFLERFKDYPFKVEMLSRFKSEKQQEKIIEQLAKGEVDLVVGTHRLLSKDIKFKDLGLLVVDEEQRFGVEHKESIKHLKTGVDVLTLSATPIPRTLHMSMSGIRDMSIMEEPPAGRFPVQTYVFEEDEQTIADAIRRELGRGGQVYLVYNRVKGINAVARRISELVPEASIAVGHGQMSETTLENIMRDFSEGRYQVLISTTIIESGLDIPNVNTIIVLDADRFGLSQLYQLRGRVGRSNRIAYAYLVYKRDKVLSEIATKRLKAIKEFTEFGSGFKLAMRDLELRGAGNLLGAEQSGHMFSIGYELYCKMLEEAVAELTGTAPIRDDYDAEGEIELSLEAYLPQTYIEDEMTRLAMYKRISQVASEEDASDVRDELTDRFGDLPRPANDLVDVALIHNKAAKNGVEKIIKQQAQLVFIFAADNPLKPELFAKLMDSFGSAMTIFGGERTRISFRLGKELPKNCALKVLSLLENDAE